MFSPTLVFIEDLRRRFYDRLDTKTGWGTEEVKRQFETAITEILTNLLDAMQDEKE